MFISAFKSLPTCRSHRSFSLLHSAQFFSLADGPPSLFLALWIVAWLPCSIVVGSKIRVLLWLRSRSDQRLSKDATMIGINAAPKIWSLNGFIIIIFTLCYFGYMQCSLYTGDRWFVPLGWNQRPGSHLRPPFNTSFLMARNTLYQCHEGGCPTSFDKWQVCTSRMSQNGLKEEI